MTEKQMHILVFHRKEGRIVARGAWGKSNIFGRCRSCGGVSIRGVCQACGFAVQCCGCRLVRQPDESWRKQGVEQEFVSHSLCPACFDKYRIIHNLFPREVVQWN